MENKKSIVSIKSLPEVLDVSEMMAVRGGATTTPTCTVKGSGTFICVMGAAISIGEGPGGAGSTDGGGTGNGSGGGK